MANDYNLNVLYDSVLSRFYFEVEYFLFEDLEHGLAEDDCVQLELLKSTNDQNIFRFYSNHEIIGDLEVELQIVTSTVSFKRIKFGDLICDSIQPELLLVFNLDQATQHELCFGTDNMKHRSIFVKFTSNSIYLLFYLNGSLMNHPEPVGCDKSICKVLHAPNPDLLHDWLFCHNHSHSHNDSGGEPAQFHIPAEVFKPIVLDCIEQVIYLLNDSESPQILLESFDDKDNSIYLQFDKRDIFASNYSNSEKHKRDESFNENNKHDLASEPFSLRMAHKCLVQHKIFGKYDDATDKTEPKSHTTKSYHYSDKKLLTKYRMSFEVVWYRIEEKLFRSLARRLIDSNERLTRLKSNFATDFDHLFESPHSEGNLSVALLNWFKFV